MGYRNHEKCCQALDNQSTVPSTTVFLISELDCQPILSYLCRRGARGLRIVVEARPRSPFDASLLTIPQDSNVEVVHSWEEVLGALSTADAEPAWQMPLFATGSGDAGVQKAADGEQLDVETTFAAGAAPDTPWTLIW